MTTQYTKITFGSLFDLLNFIVLHSPITWVLLRHRWMYIKNAFKVVGREFAERKNGSYSFKMLRYLRNTLFDKSKKNLLAVEFFFFFQPQAEPELRNWTNMYLKESCFPGCRKVSSMAPVFKNVLERSMTKNYSFISLLSVVWFNVVLDDKFSQEFMLMLLFLIASSLSLRISY